MVGYEIGLLLAVSLNSRVRNRLIYGSMDSGWFCARAGQTVSKTHVASVTVSKGERSQNF